MLCMVFIDHSGIRSLGFIHPILIGHKLLPESNLLVDYNLTMESIKHECKSR